MLVMLEVAIGVLVMEVDKVADDVTDMNMWPTWRLFWYAMIFMEMVLELVMDMEVDAVADDVSDMEVDMEVDWHGEDN